MRRDDDDGQRRVARLQRFHECDAVHAGHADVRNDDAGRTRLEHGEQRFGRLERLHGDVGLRECLLEHPAYRLVVVDDPDHGRCRAHAAASIGRRIWNTVLPGSLVNSMRPPCRWMSSCDSGSPRPVPSGRPVTSG